MKYAILETNHPASHGLILLIWRPVTLVLQYWPHLDRARPHPLMSVSSHSILISACSNDNNCPPPIPVSPPICNNHDASDFWPWPDFRLTCSLRPPLAFSSSTTTSSPSQHPHDSIIDSSSHFFSLHSDRQTLLSASSNPTSAWLDPDLCISAFLIPYSSLPTDSNLLYNIELDPHRLNLIQIANQLIKFQ